MADVNVLDLSEVTPGSGDSLILFDRATGVATSTRFETLKSAVKGTLDSQVQALEDNDELMFNVLGAKNLLPNEETTKVVYGITYTINADGSITANGTATANAHLTFAKSFRLTKGEYIYSSAVGISTDIYSLGSEEYQNGSWVNLEWGEGGTRQSNHTFINDALVRAYVVIKNGQTVNNVTFKPMIRPASIEDDTYVPYAPTNRELAAQVAKNEVLVIEVPSFSVLPQTISNANIEDDMVVVNSVLSNPPAQTSDWTVSTSSGSLTISGSISGTTTAKLYLMKSR